MSKSQRTKGAAGEREFCELLRAHGMPGAKRELGQARDSGGDVKLPPFLFEVKRRKKLAVYEFVDQVIAAAGDAGLTPVVSMRADNREWLIVMRARDALPLLRRARLDRVEEDL